ncbi:MAG: hypothetical protein AB7I30_16445 [Isosphaeraceae bacterium]
MPLFLTLILIAVFALTLLSLKQGSIPFEPMAREVARIRKWLPRPLGAALVVGFLVTLLSGVILSTEPEAFPGFLAILAVLGMALFLRAWGREFLFLMTVDDAEFPGRFDKAIWALVMIVLPPVGLWTFRTYREVRWPESLAKPEPVRDLF